MLLGGYLLSGYLDLLMWFKVQGFITTCPKLTRELVLTWISVGI